MANQTVRSCKKKAVEKSTAFYYNPQIQMFDGF